MFSLNMTTIALELGLEAPHYEELAAKFIGHFLLIAEAINTERAGMPTLWDHEDGFYYDLLTAPDGTSYHLKIRSLVGLIPLLAVAVFDGSVVKRMERYKDRLTWLLHHRPDLADNVSCLRTAGRNDTRLAALLTPDRAKKLLLKLLDETEFLSDYGIRSLSRYHKDHPFCLNLIGREFKIDYEPAESTTKLFGGNSNWRGPIWMPINYLLIEALQTYAKYLPADFTIECPTGSGHFLTLDKIAQEIASRLVRLFEPDTNGHCPSLGSNPLFKDQLLFHEYFHGDTGQGLGASHQTGWTSLIASLIQKL
jgi:hypothetical protein